MDLAPALVGWIAFASTGPLSGEAHAAAAATFAPGAYGLGRAAWLSHGASALALLWVGRRAARGAPLAALALGLACAEVFRLLSGELRAAPVTVGAGLLGTAAMLASLPAAPRSPRPEAPARDAVLAGLVLSLSGLPGASPVASAAVALAWTGRPVMLDAAALLSAPFAARAAFAAWPGLPEASERLSWGLAGAAAAAGAWLAVRWLARGVERAARLAIPYVVLLASAFLAFAWATR